MPATSETQKVLAHRQNEAQQRKQREDAIEGHMQGIFQARGDLDRALQIYQERVAVAQREICRHVEEETVYYRTYLSVQGRMSGAIQQALKRASSMDRVLTAAKNTRNQQARDEEVQHQRELRRAAQQEVQRMLLPNSDEDDLSLLYGEEVMDA